MERRISKHPEEFGKGAVAGVAGPESANNAASTGAFVPMLALGMPTGPVTAVLMAALMIHGVPPGPTLVNDHPDVFWGFVASMYVGNLMLLALNLPLVGLFVNLLRIPYAYLYPLIIMFCVIGVYEVNHSIVDVWIMLIMGVVGYGLRKFGFDPAPLVLGLVIAPTFEMSLRQSLIMSDGNWTIFFQRPIALTLLAVCAGAAGARRALVHPQPQGLAQQARGARKRARRVNRRPDPIYGRRRFCISDRPVPTRNMLATLSVRGVVPSMTGLPVGRCRNCGAPVSYFARFCPVCHAANLPNPVAVVAALGAVLLVGGAIVLGLLLFRTAKASRRPSECVASLRAEPRRQGRLRLDRPGDGGMRRGGQTQSSTRCIS